MSSTSNKVNKYVLSKINSYYLPITDPTHKKHPLAVIMKRLLKKTEMRELVLDGLPTQREHLFRPASRRTGRRVRTNYGIIGTDHQRLSHACRRDYAALATPSIHNPCKGMIEILWEHNCWCNSERNYNRTIVGYLDVKELKRRCKMNGITRYSHLRRVELIQALMRV